MIRFNEEQQRDLASNEGVLPRTIDPATNSEYVLIRAEAYERLKPLFEHDPASEREQVAQLQEFGRRAGWEDPGMANYDDLRPSR